MASSTAFWKRAVRGCPDMSGGSVGLFLTPSLRAHAVGDNHPRAERLHDERL